jgi:hypothetical protein
MLQRKVVVCDIFVVLLVALVIYVNPALSQLGEFNFFMKHLKYKMKMMKINLNCGEKFI